MPMTRAAAQNRCLSHQMRHLLERVGHDDHDRVGRMVACLRDAADDRRVHASQIGAAHPGLPRLARSDDDVIRAGESDKFGAA